MSKTNEALPYQDEHGQIIPYLMLAVDPEWPEGLVRAIKQRMRLTPSECRDLKPGTQKRFEFDQLVRLWHSTTQQKTRVLSDLSDQIVNELFDGD